ncbi:hypothetical protein ACFVYC_13605 [Pseudarthrobacter sp. NPDC058329]|uniref:hypothetical protein n=1 Tax=Pseudarthrobacter sp. NPDC058329 TaxID=3346448 RepID=UPI0036DA9520
MRWLLYETQVAAAGPEAQIGTVAAIIAAVAAAFSALIGLYALRRTEAREHHRWLQEKRREAYVEFIMATRDTYEAISARGKSIGAEDLTEDYSEPKSKDLLKTHADIDDKEGAVTRALDLLVIVGPESMITAGRRVKARLRLDRVYYSPTRWTQLNMANKARIMQYAEATGDAGLLADLKDAYFGGPVDLEKYRQAHRDHRLDVLWTAFTTEAQKVLENPTPVVHGSDDTAWSKLIRSARRNL